jgi:hypothetical protein
MPLIEGFLHPALAVGALLASVPLIIHLLNRHRHRPMPWAAMRFVLAAYRRTRRRAHLENLILLLLRMAAVALLAFALARPFTGSESPLSALTESRRNLVVVLDGSASTGYREGVDTVFSRIVERARETVLELEGGRGDSVHLLLCGRYPRLLSWRTPEEALSLLATLSEPTDETLDLAAALGEVVRFAEEDAAGAGKSGLEVHLLCDLQRESFEGSSESIVAAEDAPAATPGAAEPAEKEPPQPPAMKLREELDRLAELGITVIVQDLGPADLLPPNLGIAGIAPAGEPGAPGTPVDVEVSVANFGGTSQQGVRVTLAVDGEKRPSQRLDIPARSTQKATFTTTFAQDGSHVLQAQIDNDRLTGDDVRAHVLRVPPPVRALLVNGAPSADIERDEVGFLSAVLSPPNDDGPAMGPQAAPFAVRVIEPHELREESLSLDEFDVVFLANVAGVTEGSVMALEEWVASGGALIVSVGDQVDRDIYGARLFRPDGTGLLPAELIGHVAVASRREAYYRVRSFQTDHRALAFFADERWQPLFTEVPIYEFFAARPLDSAKVLARLDDDAGSPLLIERPYDQGLVFLWLTTIDPAWTRLPESPRTFVPFVHEWLRYAGAPRAPVRNLAVGDELREVVEGYPRNLVLVHPDQTRTPVDREPLALGRNRWQLPAIADTAKAGLYVLESEGMPPLPFAVCLEAREGDLTRMDPEELAAFHPALHLVQDLAKGSDAGSPPKQGELWRWLAGACLAALVLESFWAAFIGRSRRSRSSARSSP